MPSKLNGLPVGSRPADPDVALISLGVGVHRCLQVARTLAERGVGCMVVDLRSASPLDRQAILDAAHATGRVVVVDED
jgi:acetoin:2,6-dichlorophenolindophenol oxidoreductase subunit beta